MLAGPISASLRPDNTAPFDKMKQWQVTGKTATDMTSRRFEPQPPVSGTNALPLDKLACSTKLFPKLCAQKYV